MALAMDSSTSSCSCGSQSWQSYSQLKHILPLHYNYQVCSFSELPDSAFHAILRMPVTTEEDMRLWIKELEEMTKVTFRVTRTFPHVGLKNVFREIYHCQHSGRRNNEKGRKNTACKATLGVTVKRCVKRSKAKKDGHLPSFPTIVDLHWEHNHNLNSAAVLQLRDVSDQTKDVFLELFEKGHTPSSAMDLYKSNIHLSSGEEYVYVAADRSVVPDAQSIYRLYQKQFTDLYGNQGAQNIDQRITDMVDGLIKKNCNVAWKRTDDSDQIILAIITPIMKRILIHVQQSSEMLFVDSTGNCDRHGVRVFLLLTHCSAGGVPVGCLLTTSESYITLHEALNLYLSILPDGAFGSHGHPCVIMTDDCEALRKALASVFPQSTLLLCTFHVLQAVWRWLWDSKHAVQKQHRPNYFFQAKAMLTAKSEEEIKVCLESVVQVCAAHPRFVEYIKKLFCRKEEWALCYRGNLFIRGNNTNNFVEAAMKIFKDKVLHRTKACNILQLIDFVTSYLEDFYCRLLIDVANGRCTSRKKGLVREGSVSIPKESISLEDDTYLVKSETQTDVTYAVDMDLGMCTCLKGWNGGGCKHQAAVILHFGMGSLNFLPVTPREQNHFYFLATGNQLNTNNNWFAPLRSATVTSNELGEEQQGLEQEISVENESSNINVIDRTDDVPLDVNVSNEIDSPADAPLLDKFQKIDDFATIIKELLQTDRQYFEPAVDMFLSSVQKINTHSHWFSSLCSFGKYSGCSSKGKLTTSTKRIGIQPTAIARRKHKLRGRNIVRAGRPTKKFLTSQKYTASKEILRAVLPKRKAPHNLSLCVSNNESLGKTHSAK